MSSFYDRWFALAQHCAEQRVDPALACGMHAVRLAQAEAYYTWVSKRRNARKVIVSPDPLAEAYRNAPLLRADWLYARRPGADRRPAAPRGRAVCLGAGGPGRAAGDAGRRLVRRGRLVGLVAVGPAHTDGDGSSAHFRPPRRPQRPLPGQSVQRRPAHPQLAEAGRRRVG
jgi:hypothetical protein